MTDLLLTLGKVATIALLLALYDYHFSRQAIHMQFQWWSPLIPLLTPLLRSIWQTLAAVVAVVTVILIVGHV